MDRVNEELEKPYSLVVLDYDFNNKFDKLAADAVAYAQESGVSMTDAVVAVLCDTVTTVMTTVIMSTDFPMVTQMMKGIHARAMT